MISPLMVAAVKAGASVLTEGLRPLGDPFVADPTTQNRSGGDSQNG